MTDDVRAARGLLGEKEVFRISKPAQPRRISPASAPAGWKALRQVRFHLNLLRDLKRINAHVASAAYPILEKRGELLSSRLRQET
jgi:phosphate:Na+ symporter